MKVLWTMGLLAVLGGCATSSPDVIQRGDAQRMSEVIDATDNQHTPFYGNLTKSGGLLQPF